MTMLKVLAAATLVIGCTVLRNAYPQERAPDLKKAEAGRVSFVYSTTDFAGVTIKKMKKNTVLGKGGPADGEGESPEHYCFNLKDESPLPALEQGSRYFLPSDTFICAFPLQDASVKDFSKAYFPLNRDAVHLRKLLRDHPDNLERWREATKIDIPDFPDLDAENSIVSKFQYLDFRSGSGILFLTQYANELEPNPVNNEELTLDFQGLTTDGRYYVAARLAITHPSLPRGIDFTNDIKRDGNRNYLKKEEKELDRLPEESFQPSMTGLKAMLSSLQIQ